MTIELDNIIKNLNDCELVIELTKPDEDGSAELYVGTDDATGACYNVQTVDEVGEMIVHYLNTYFSEVDDESN